MHRRSDLFGFLAAGVLCSTVLVPVLAREINGDVSRDQTSLALSEPRVESPLGSESAQAESQDLGSVDADAESSETLQPLAVSAPPPVPVLLHVSTGEASWYGPGFFGNRTASGEVFRPGTMTAAHRTLPFGTKVRVTNLWNGRTAVVRINDRGPFRRHRVIDLAHGAAHQLGLATSGIAQVRLEVLR